MKTLAEVWQFISQLPDGETVYNCDPGTAKTIKSLIWDYGQAYINDFGRCNNTSGLPVSGLSNPAGLKFKVYPHQRRQWSDDYVKKTVSYAGNLKLVCQAALEAPQTFDPEGRVQYARILVSNYNTGNNTNLAVKTDGGKLIIFNRETHLKRAFVPGLFEHLCKQTSAPGFYITPEQFSQLKTELQEQLNILRTFVKIEVGNE